MYTLVKIICFHFFFKQQQDVVASSTVSENCNFLEITLNKIVG